MLSWAHIGLAGSLARHLFTLSELTIVRVLILGTAGVGKTTLVKRFQSPAGSEEEDKVPSFDKHT